MGTTCSDTRKPSSKTDETAVDGARLLVPQGATAEGMPVSAQSDDCILCMENLADVMFPCGHRVVCQNCDTQWREKAFQKGKIAVCPLDRVPVDIDTVIDNSQYHPVQVSEDRNGPRSVHDIVAENAVGFKLGTHPRPGDSVTPELLAEVRLAMRAVKVGKLDLEQLHRELRHRLTGSQMQLVFVEISKDADLHCVMLQSESLYLEQYAVWKEMCKSFVIEVCEAKSWTEMTLPTTAARAGATTAAATTVELVTEQQIVAGSAFSGASMTAAGGAAGVVFLLFGGFELYRWSKGEISSKEAALNCGEHFVGGVASVAGIAAGGGIVAVSGCALPGVGIVLGFVLAVLFGLAARYGYRYSTQDCLDQQKQNESRMHAIRGAAQALGIDLELDDFHVAKIKFRKKLLQSHPDKFPESQREEKTQETSTLLLWWQLVRGYYEGSLGGRCRDLDEDEGYISVWVKKVRSGAEGQWQIVRSWIGSRDSEPAAQNELEIVEECRIYV